MRLQRILQFQRQHLAPRQAAWRPQRATKDALSTDSSGYFAAAKFAAFSAARSGTLAPGYKQPALVNGSTNRSHTFATHVTAPAMKADVLLVNRRRDNPLTALPLIEPLRSRHELLLPGRYWSQPVRGVRVATPIGDESHRFQSQTVVFNHSKVPTQLHPTDDPDDSARATLRRYPVSNAPSLRAVENAKAFCLPSSRYSVRQDESSLRAPPPPKDEQFGPDGFTNQGFQVGQESRRDTSAYIPQLGKASSSAAMIHLDGSALGRWTIQHLERTLGKPATGMTGVDPRASPPRSRVSPF